MKIAIAGPGELARYFLEELPKQHDVVVLTRNRKDWVSQLNIPQRVTDYSVSNIAENLVDRDILISTLCLYTMENVTIHLNMLEACQKSTRCKKFIPSEWGGDIETYPDQPAFYFENHEPIRQALREQKEVQWTLVINGWFLEYVVPLKNRYLKSAGEIWPMDDENKVMTMYGKGTHAVDLTSARDVGKALAELVKHDNWEPYTYIAGEQTSWYSLYETIRKRDPSWQKKPLSLVQSINRIIAKESEWSVIQGWFEVYSHSDATAVSVEKVKEHKRKYFSTVKFRGVEEILDAAAAKPENVV